MDELDLLQYLTLFTFVRERHTPHEMDIAPLKTFHSHIRLRPPPRGISCRSVTWKKNLSCFLRRMNPKMSKTTCGCKTPPDCNDFLFLVELAQGCETANVQPDLLLRALFASLRWVLKYFHAEGYHNMTSSKAKQSIPSPSAQRRKKTPICFSAAVSVLLLHLLPLLCSFYRDGFPLFLFIPSASLFPSLLLSSCSAIPPN